MISNTVARVRCARRSRNFAFTAVVCSFALCVGTTVQAQGGREASPAAEPVKPTVTPQTYSQALVETGATRFAASCGFCHGRDAAGGQGGADLTRSDLVARDVRGDLIGEVVRSGRPDAGMPAFADMSNEDLDAIVAFVHSQKNLAEQSVGGRRSVLASDLATGNARAGERYFENNCTSCHSPTGDLAGVGARYEGLALLQRMLYPGRGGRGRPAPAPTVTVSTPDGKTVTGSLAYRDEFEIALTEKSGRYRSWSATSVEFTVDDPLEAHVAQLGRYTDEAMHDVYRYLQSLR